MIERKRREIKLTTGQIALVDEEDFELVNQSNWYVINNGKWMYAQSRRDGPCILMHHLIIGYPPPSKMVDHIDNNGLNNQRSNLRFVTNQQNQARRKKTDGPHLSKFKGVSFRKDTKKWVAYIRVNYRMINLGHFINEEDAARAYDKAAIETFGEYAQTNFGASDG